MLKIRVIPCLLLKDLGLVKTVKFTDPKYVGDPINAVKIFNDKEVDELIFLDIISTNKKRKPSFELLSRIASEAFMPFSYGGGLRSIEDVKRIMEIGVEKVVINTYAFENPEFIKEIADMFGSQSVVVSIDVKKNKENNYEVFVHSGQLGTKINPVDFAIKMEKIGAGEIFLNSIDRDGTMEGFDLELIKNVSSSVNIPVIVSGGAGKIEDFAKAVESGASAVAAGSFFVFVGPYRAVLINYPDKKELRKVLK
ncbi:imidazole glycerol phosphate synthase subunit HisF [Patescibacteria group bacterium]|nr:imidazole glycerol phosphate synthase subunit HisF [Patescibacteria group bacterium]